MAIAEQLKDFFKTGVLKKIRYGLTRDELTSILGETDWKHFSSNKDKYPSIYKYGRIEFYFMTKSKYAGLTGIMFQPIPSPASNGKLKCNYNWLTKNTDIKTAIKFLKSNKIKFQEKVYKWDKTTKLLLTEGNIDIFFDCQRRSGHYVLHKAGRFVD